MAPLPNHRCPILLRTAQNSRVRALVFVAAHESVVGTNATCRLHRAMSAISGNPEDMSRRRLICCMTMSKATLNARLDRAPSRASGVDFCDFLVGPLDGLLRRA